MKSNNLTYILFVLVFVNINTLGQGLVSSSLMECKTMTIAQAFAHEILSIDKINVEFHTTYYNLNNTPRLYIYKCNYLDDSINRTLTLHLSADSNHSLTAYYFDNPIDEEINMKYDKIFICNHGMMLKINDYTYKRYPDYKNFSLEELLLNPNEETNSYKLRSNNNVLLNNGKKVNNENISESDSVEYIISGVPNYLWYLDCGLTSDLMIIGYWNDNGYPNLIPDGDSQTGFYWAVGEESSYWSGAEYYTQAAEYGNSTVSETIILWNDVTWNAYKNFLDTYKIPIKVIWGEDGPYGGLHATVGIGYKEIDSLKFLILNDTWRSTPTYISYNEYSTTIRQFHTWHPVSKATGNSIIPAKNSLLDEESMIAPEEIIFSPALDPENKAYHHFEFADLNGDNKKDFIIRNFRNHHDGFRLQIYHYSEGEYILDTYFRPDFELDEIINVSKVFDFDNDGDLDIAVAGIFSPVKIFINNGDRILNTPIIIEKKGLRIIEMDFGDLDNDGDLDLITSSIPEGLRIYENDNGIFNKVIDLNNDGLSFKVRFEDLNNDSYPDIVASKRNGTILVYFNNSGSFSDTSFSPVGHGGMSFDVGDINNDSWPDIITINDGTLIIYYNSGGVFTDNPEVITGQKSFAKDLFLSDLDNDEFPELIVGNFNSPNFILKNEDGHYNDQPLWSAENVDPTFSINVFNDNISNNKLIAFGKSRGGKIEFFEIQAFDISISANPSNSGSVSGEGTYNYGQICKLSATALPGYSFINWTENGMPASTDRKFHFTVTENRTLVANFENTVNIAEVKNDGNISIYPNPSTGKVIIEGENIETITLVNMNGRIIKRIKVDSDVTNIDLSDQTKGIYFIEIISRAKVITKKIMLGAIE